jgi:hypothetical protein
MNNWDDIFGYADEAIDWLKPALEKAEKIQATARLQADTQLPVLTTKQIAELRQLGKDLLSNIDDADTSARNLWEEVRDL